MRQFEPHRLAWNALAILIGVSALVTPPVGLAVLVAPWLLWLWAFALIGSGALGIVAPLQDTVDGLATERGALWVQTGTLVWIVISSVYLRGLVELFGLAAYLVWIAANAVRDRQIAWLVKPAPARLRPPRK